MQIIPAFLAGSRTTRFLPKWPPWLLHLHSQLLKTAFLPHCRRLHICTGCGRVEACTRERTTLDQCLLDLRLVAAHRCTRVTFQHVKSHEGLPGNEFADSAAKACLRGQLIENPNVGVFSRDQRFGSAWIPFSGRHQKGELPSLDDVGHTLPDTNAPLPIFHVCSTVPGIPAPLTTTPDLSEADAAWDLCLATYNINTLKKEADRQLLDTMLHCNGVHIAGIQETRSFPGARTQSAHYACFASADIRGNLGCQIWVSNKLPVATRVDAHKVMLEPKAATVLHSSPRLLAVCVPAGKVLLGLICAHAPIEAASDGEKDAWWDLLRSVMRRLPCRAVPVLLIDGNARFDASATDARIHTARAVTNNAERLQTIGTEACLHSAPLFDHQGMRVVTWTSPAGKDTQLDYVLIPDKLASAANTLGSPSHAYQHSGVDHWPLLVRVRWRQPTKGTRPGVQWDRAKMRTAEGRSILRDIYATLPSLDVPC